jgi:deoxyribonucleoside regulator
MDANRLRMLARVAEMYYISKLSQSQIAARMGYSRSMVSRLLSEAHEKGVVEIRINHPLQRHLDLEDLLTAYLDLQYARVLQHSLPNYAETLSTVGALAAQLLEELLEDSLMIGTSWGTGVYETIRALNSFPLNDIKVVQMLGSLGTSNPTIDGPEIVWRLAEKLFGHYATLPVPLLVESEATRHSLLSAPHLASVIESYQRIDLALVGIGTVSPARASLLRAGYMDVNQLEELRQAGAVGDVCVNHFDIHGNIIDTPLTRRLVTISTEDLLRIPLKVGVAISREKVAPIVGACRAGLVNALVTDEKTATEVVKMIQGEIVINVN